MLVKKSIKFPGDNYQTDFSLSVRQFKNYTELFSFFLVKGVKQTFVKFEKQTKSHLMKINLLFFSWYSFFDEYYQPCFFFFKERALFKQ